MATPQVKLHISPGTCAIIPQILLHYAGITYQPIGNLLKDLGPGTKFSSVHNPKGQVPILLLDDETITEVPAIAHAVSHLAPQAKILGRTPMELVRVCEWMNFLSGAIHAQAWSPYARPWRFTDEKSGEEGVKRKSFEKLGERYSLIEFALPEKGWVVGDGFTAVDAYLLPLSQWAEKRAGIDIGKDYPKWESLVKRVQELEAVKKAIAEEERIGKELSRDGE